ncbi:MAG: MarR family transcriptional regulator [Oscillibacter sp.]|nr:MarR family transcriptional regulator [Oscillibacter sp.]MBQ7682344.1 MarR family transcriptional regulator [Oscillibacter sp.]
MTEALHRQDVQPEALLLKNQLCFPLYACAREMVKKYKPYLDQIGLTYTQYITMMVLWEQHSVTAKELGQRLYLDSGTLTPLLKRMEAKGLLTRQRDPVDERSLRVTVTDAGEALKERALDIPYQMAQHVKLTQEETETLYKLLYVMLKSD